MADFFSNLDYITGGSTEVPTAFKSLFADYQPASVPAQYMPPAATQVAAPAAPAEPPRRGMWGNLGQMIADRYNNTIQPSSGFVTVGDAPAGGLYAGNVTYNPGTSAFSSIDPNAYMSDRKTGASQLAADVQRAQYQDYLNRFAPIENFAVNQIRGKQTADLGYDLARANQSVMNAGVNMIGQQDRAMGRYGLRYEGPTTADRNEITGGRVAAINQARMADEQRALNLLAGGTGSGGGQ